MQVIDNPALARQKRPARTGRTPSLLPSVLATWLTRLRKVYPGTKPPIGLRVVNAGLAGLCGVLTLVWLVDLFNARREFRGRLEAVERNVPIEPVGARKEPPPPVNLTQLIDDATNHNIFTFVPTKIEAAIPAVPPAGPDDNGLQDLKLVGIIWSAHPQAIIEQAKEERTYLLSVGEAVGPLTIKQIFQDKVIFGQEGGDQTWELR